MEPWLSKEAPTWRGDVLVPPPGLMLGDPEDPLSLPNWDCVDREGHVRRGG